jgi:hypothetical protein
MWASIWSPTCHKSSATSSCISRARYRLTPLQHPHPGRRPASNSSCVHLQILNNPTDEVAVVLFGSQGVRQQLMTGGLCRRSADAQHPSAASQTAGRHHCCVLSHFVGCAAQQQ